VESSGRDADAASGNLAAGDLGALVTLGVRAALKSRSIDESLIGIDILLKKVQINNERRRHQIAQASSFSYDSAIG
jgi:hypothetical protein